MNRDYKINDEQLERLRGLPPECWQLFIILIKRMDFKTGMVGVKRGCGVSIRGLCEEMHIETHCGISKRDGYTCSGDPTPSKLKRLLVRLEKAGLITRFSEERKRFICQINFATIYKSASSASYDSYSQSVQKQAGPKPDQRAEPKPDHSNFNNNNGLSSQFNQNTTQAEPEGSQQAGPHHYITNNYYNKRDIENYIYSQATNPDTNTQVPQHPELPPEKPTSPLEPANPIQKQVIDHLNEKAGRSFKHTKSNLSHITARIREGFTLEDFQKVIDFQISRWSGTEYAQYLRPQTLFGPKMESYLEAAKAVDNPHSSNYADINNAQASTKQSDNYAKNQPRRQTSYERFKQSLEDFERKHEADDVIDGEWSTLE